MVVVPSHSRPHSFSLSFGPRCWACVRHARGVACVLVVMFFLTKFFSLPIRAARWSVVVVAADGWMVAYWATACSPYELWCAERIFMCEFFGWRWEKRAHCQPVSQSTMWEWCIGRGGWVSAHRACVGACVCCVFMRICRQNEKKNGWSAVDVRSSSCVWVCLRMRCMDCLIVVLWALHTCVQRQRPISTMDEWNVEENGEYARCMDMYGMEYCILLSAGTLESGWCGIFLPVGIIYLNLFIYYIYWAGIENLCRINELELVHNFRNIFCFQLLLFGRISLYKCRPSKAPYAREYLLLRMYSYIVALIQLPHVRAACSQMGRLEFECSYVFLAPGIRDLFNENLMTNYFIPSNVRTSYSRLVYSNVHWFAMPEECILNNEHSFPSCQPAGWTISIQCNYANIEPGSMITSGRFSSLRVPSRSKYTAVCAHDGDCVCAVYTLRT